MNRNDPKLVDFESAFVRLLTTAGAPESLARLSIEPVLQRLAGMATRLAFLIVDAKSPAEVDELLRADAAETVRVLGECQAALLELAPPMLRRAPTASSTHH